MSEIAEGIGMPKSTLQRYVQAMQEDGKMECNGHRGVTPTNSKGAAVRAPILGRVSCGLPKFAEENIEGYVQLPVALFGKGEFYLLRANGDSMIEAGIEDGDIVVIRHQNTAEAGQIVVALTNEDEATLKRFYPEPQHNRYRLHPENSQMEDIYVDRCEIQGVAVKVLKDLD